MAAAPTVASLFGGSDVGAAEKAARPPIDPVKVTSGAESGVNTLKWVAERRQQLAKANLPVAQNDEIKMHLDRIETAIRQGKWRVVRAWLNNPRGGQSVENNIESLLGPSPSGIRLTPRPPAVQQPVKR